MATGFRLTCIQEKPVGTLREPRRDLLGYELVEVSVRWKTI